MPSILQASRDPRVLDRLELEARSRARALVAEAEAEAARIRAVAEHERAEALEAAAAAGRQQGLASAAAARLDAVAARERRLAEVEREIAEVALEVARAIVGKAVSERPELVVDLARRALDPVRRRREILVRVNPSDGACLRARQEHLHALLDRAPGIVVKEDAQVDRGGVVVETEAGCVDARVETQLAILERALAEQVS